MLKERFDAQYGYGAQIDRGSYLANLGQRNAALEEVEKGLGSIDASFELSVGTKAGIAVAALIWLANGAKFEPDKWWENFYKFFFVPFKNIDSFRIGRK